LAGCNGGRAAYWLAISGNGRGADGGGDGDGGRDGEAGGTI